MKFEDIHSECQQCENLKAWSINMNSNHDYACRKMPSKFISKNQHQEGCKKFEKVLMVPPEPYFKKVDEE